MEVCEKQIQNSDEFEELYNGPPNSPAFYRLGWRDALEWAYKQETDPQATEIGDAILRELKED